MYTHADFIVVHLWEIHPQVPYPDIELTGLYAILLMLSTRLGSDKYHFYDSTTNQTPNLPQVRPTLYRFGYRTHVTIEMHTDERTHVEW